MQPVLIFGNVRLAEIDNPAVRPDDRQAPYFAMKEPIAAPDPAAGQAWKNAMLLSITKDYPAGAGKCADDLIQVVPCHRPHI
ncbi:MAG: hypothetical protein JWQ21_2044 [Herminiimonas sp.]|nr:hypothetical protein [Herminiimonas sp.]